MDNTAPPSDGASRPSQQRDPVSESDLDPAAFLRSVRELSEKREREDAERFRKLEEDIERGRRERAVRRAGASADTAAGRQTRKNVHSMSNSSKMLSNARPADYLFLLST